jgi:hypothetical protein
MKVFFYGLFMDADLLAKKGITPQDAVVAHVDGFSLRIGERATLVRTAGARAYGVIMEITPSEATDLYAESSVADYVAEPVISELIDGSKVAASCFILPNDKVSGTNKDYAEALSQVAHKLGLPENYIAEIKRACD